MEKKYCSYRQVFEEAAILIYLQMSVQREQKKSGMMWNFFL